MKSSPHAEGLVAKYCGRALRLICGASARIAHQILSGVTKLFGTLFCMGGVFLQCAVGTFAVCFTMRMCLHALRRKILNGICVAARINKFAL